MFRRNTTRKDDDMMTIGGFSMGTSSVSDRIMGRMRMSLSGISGRNLASGEGGDSLDSGSTDGGNRSRRSLRSKKSFSRGRKKRRSSSLGISATRPMAGMDSSVNNVRSSRNGVGSSNVIDGMMAEMDSTETMALTGRSMGRAPSAPPLRPGVTQAPSAPALRSGSIAGERFGSPRSTGKPNKPKSSSVGNLKTSGALEPPPMEYSLAQLRQMSEHELEKTIQKAGISSEEVESAIDEKVEVDMSMGTIAEEQRKNALVMLLINSGKVKLVRADRRQSSTRTLLTSNSFADSRRDSMFDGTDLSITSIPYNDEAGASVRSGMSISSSRRGDRKSKLDKIFELQTENSNIKRENKSLKKTVKKLLGQLTTMTQKEKEAIAMADKYKDECESLAQSKMSEIEEVKEDATESASGTNDEAPGSQIILSRRDSDISIDKIKKKLKEEKHAHLSTEFRLKAEIDLLTREVEGLQKQLAQSLKTIEKKEQSARDNREATSKLKRKLSNAASTVTKLKNEAEARDKLIETFTKILLQKIGVEGDENGSLDGSSTVGAERMDLSVLEQSLKMSMANDMKV